MTMTAQNQKALVSKLVPVDIKLVWPMEASSFTPWLLDNAAMLGDALGLDLELDAAEHKVGGFSLDLIGTDTDTGGVVIVENQFGTTDHRHLGQLLTYAGGTAPTTAVWIAERFRDEHRAALDWMNQRTDSDTRFFGVELRAVTILGAPKGLVAPMLDVVVQPNEWGKAVKQATAVGVSDREALYLKFWTRWLERVSTHGWTNRKALAQHWMYLPSGLGAARYTVSFRQDGLRSELFFHHEDPEVNLARWEVLHQKRAELDSAFGDSLLFDPLPNRKGCRIAIERRDGESIKNGESWVDYEEWFEETQLRLRAAIEKVGGVPPLPAIEESDESGDLIDEASQDAFEEA